MAAVVAISCSPAASRPAPAPVHRSQVAPKGSQVAPKAPQVVHERSQVVREGSRWASSWWCTHRSSQLAQDFCAQDRLDCEAKRELVSTLALVHAPGNPPERADWTPCSEKTQVYCHEATRERTHIVGPHRTLCYETNDACRRSSRAFTATNTYASSCFTLGAEGRLRPD